MATEIQLFASTNKKALFIIIIIIITYANEFSLGSSSPKTSTDKK